MSKFISSNELWDHIEEKCIPMQQRDIGNISTNQDYGNINIDYFNTGYGISYSSFIANFNQDTIIEGNNRDDFSFLFFNTGDNIYMENLDKKEQIRLDTNRCWSGMIYKGHNAYDKYRKKQQYIFHSLVFDNDFFNTLIQNNDELQTKEDIIKSDYFSANFSSHISNKQKSILSDIMKKNNLNDALHQIYLESKILELIYITFNQSFSKHTASAYFSQKDIESVKRAKEILLQNYEKPPSLKNLAYKSAINQLKLQEGFKKLYGNTVFGYLQEYRLNKAKELLEHDDINVSEASILVGYKSLSHFSKIFKERFGMNAIDVRR